MKKKGGRPKQPLSMPTPEQEIWLKANYRMYNRVGLCKQLKIRDKELSAWFKLLRLKKRDGKSAIVTDEQAAFIEANYKKMRHEQMANKLGISVITVHGYCRKNGLRKIKQPLQREPRLPPEPKEIIVFHPAKPFIRPKADHTNISREQRIDYWLNYPI
jgi:hypothetical protein